jgi:hypothetical protein
VAAGLSRIERTPTMSEIVKTITKQFGMLTTQQLWFARRSYKKYGGVADEVFGAED